MKDTRGIKYIGLNELRRKFLNFFEARGHMILKSFPLVPIGDKSMLLINSGMAPLKPYFSGEKIPPSRRVATCQKCVRTGDIENVGKTSRHGTFFEMLGNFSFGDYFKHEAISWSWEFLTKELELPAELLYPSVYLEDDEAFDIWTKEIGLDPSRVTRLGKGDNFWELGVGPCGPCSEIYFDRGVGYGCGSPTCGPGCDCDRFIEIWNNVFTQFNSDGKGGYAPLVKKNIDTGMGLERLAIVMQGVETLVEIDTIKSVLDKTAEVAGIKYNADKKRDVSIRIITDHIRSAVFLVSDNVIPSNEGRGYVLRRLLRRAARHGKLLNIKEAFLYNLADTVIGSSKDAYPELEEKRGYIKKVLRSEEDRFQATLDAGLEILERMIDETKKSGSTVLSGENAFKLYDTYGFPTDLTSEICEDASLTVDTDGFEKYMEDQKSLARSSRKGTEGWTVGENEKSGEEPTRFIGYTALDSDDCTVISAVRDGKTAKIILNKTTFYAESGGQVGDTGLLIVSDDITLAVIDCKKNKSGQFVHICVLKSDSTGEEIPKPGDKVRAIVDALRRRSIARNHSSAHLLQAALRKILGTHVEQAGSYVDSERVRFDFTHFAQLSEEETRGVELLVNQNILAGHDIVMTETTLDKAREAGATALFGEKYGDVVRMVKMGAFSTELCGGTHMDNTAKVGLFKIISESGIAAGVRRIEGTTGMGVLDLIAHDKDLINETASILKSPNPKDIAKKAETITAELKDKVSEIDKLNVMIAKARKAGIPFTEINGVKYYAAGFDDNITPDVGKAMAEDFAKTADAVSLISVETDGKVSLFASAGTEAVKRGASAGNLIKIAAKICGGGGGGKHDFATAGGKDASKVAEAIKAVQEALTEMVK
ncbi:alanine--tRNA ligase [Clostridia bacterium]|nr:alanine--tRNA ligase [Clostridia bacterium]